MQNLDQLEAVYKESHETIMGNCDTHLFLGSNSQKTVEYFSKALGEKTIYRDSESINKDRNDWKQGKSVSEQNMARALLTPDELRRLDVDKCIIYEKGLKPIKADKYYYYKYPIDKKIRAFRVDHNEREDIDRGKWRKYNPYNPDPVEEEKKQPAKIQQLDDLFTDEQPKEETKKQETIIEEPKVETPEKPKQQAVDLQKEMEAKFDELFGSLNDVD